MPKDLYCFLIEEGLPQTRTPYEKGKIQRVSQRELGKDHSIGLFSQAQWWVECSDNDFFVCSFRFTLHQAFEKAIIKPIEARN